MKNIRELTRLTWTPLYRPLALFFLSALLGVVVAYDSTLSWPLLPILGGSLLLYLALTGPLGTAPRLHALAWMLVLGQTAVALFFITQFDHQYGPKLYRIWRLGHLTASLFPRWGRIDLQRNALATLLEGGLPLAFGLAWASRRRLGRWGGGLCFALLSYALLLTASRGAWVAAAVCAAAALGWRVRPWLASHRRQGALALGGLALVAGLGLALWSPDPLHLPGVASTVARALDRTELYRNSLYLIGDSPVLGIGLGDTFKLVYSRYILLIPHVYLTYPHNLLLAVWLNQGLLGLLSLGWTLGAWGWLIVHTLRARRGTPLFWGATGAVLIMLLHGLTDAPEYDRGGYFLLALCFSLLGLSVASAYRAGIHPGRSPIPLPACQRTRRIAGVALLLAGALVFYRSGALDASLGTLYQTRADLGTQEETARQVLLERAAGAYQRALRLNGRNAVAHWRLGLIALDDNRFREAITHLEAARPALPGHRGVRKALGYACLWNGQLAQAQALLAPLPEIPTELDTWRRDLQQQGQDQLAWYAAQLQARLRP